jgi:hypothetical protein
MKTKLAIILLHLAANGADAYLTHRGMQMPIHRETNPIARTFVTHGTPMLVGYFATDTALEFAGAWELRRHHHPKLARGWEVFNIADHTGGVVVCLAEEKAK